MGDPEAETLQLTEIRHLNSDELRAANAAALQMDERAYHTAGNVYAKTEPAH